MEPQQIKNQFKLMKRNLLIWQIIGMVLFMPHLILMFSELDSFLGISKQAASVIFVAVLVNTFFCYFTFWKCPACKKRLKSGRAITQCSHCGAELQ